MADAQRYTAISFAPVQGFIEKSRKLRDLYGASLILSYLSSKLVEKARELGLELVTPGLPELKEGTPNRIIVRGNQVFSREEVQNTLLGEWRTILRKCRVWVEKKLDIPKEQYEWAQKTEEIGKQKGEWERWESYTWEIFWGWGDSVENAMQDLETRKLKRDWTGINWMGESSSLSGTDAIAWHGLGKESERLWEWSQAEKGVKAFYEKLAKALEEPSSTGKTLGKFLDPNERLSIPELVKRLVTRPEEIGLGKEFRIDSFAPMVRLPQPGQPGHWTGWFMGDGDEVGKKLKELARNSEEIQPLQEFSDEMRNWGKAFKRGFNKDLGRVIYGGGDDFLGVIYSENPEAPIAASRALEWLMGFNQEWNTPVRTIKINVSMGFVWAGYSVPQRDVLQHCRKAEKRSKQLGRDRATIRVVFNSGQFVQWTCPWDYLHVLQRYRDHKGGQNWTHVYNDWATLKARHAVRLQEMEDVQINKEVALALFNFYFDDAGSIFQQERKWEYLTGGSTNHAIVRWIDELIQVGWQLCRTNSSNP